MGLKRTWGPRNQIPVSINWESNSVVVSAFRKEVDAPRLTEDGGRGACAPPRGEFPGSSDRPGVLIAGTDAKGVGVAWRLFSLLPEMKRLFYSEPGQW